MKKNLEPAEREAGQGPDTPDLTVSGSTTTTKGLETIRRRRK